MIRQHLTDAVVSAIGRAPVVALLGPRQSGKTTIAGWDLHGPAVDAVVREYRQAAGEDTEDLLPRHRHLPSGDEHARPGHSGQPSEAGAVVGRTGFGGTDPGQRRLG